MFFLRHEKQSSRFWGSCNLDGGSAGNSAGQRDESCKLLIFNGLMLFTKLDAKRLALLQREVDFFLSFLNLWALDVAGAELSPEIICEIAQAAKECVLSMSFTGAPSIAQSGGLKGCIA